MEFIGKKYKMVSSENFNDFMKAIGVGAAFTTALAALRVMRSLVIMRSGKSGI